MVQDESPRKGIRFQVAMKSLTLSAALSCWPEAVLKRLKSPRTFEGVRFALVSLMLMSAKVTCCDCTNVIGSPVSELITVTSEVTDGG